MGPDSEGLLDMLRYLLLGLYRLIVPSRSGKSPPAYDPLDEYGSDPEVEKEPESKADRKARLLKELEEYKSLREEVARRLEITPVSDTGVTKAMLMKSVVEAAKEVRESALPFSSTPGRRIVPSEALGALAFSLRKLEEFEKDHG